MMENKVNKQKIRNKRTLTFDKVHFTWLYDLFLRKTKQKSSPTVSRGVRGFHPVTSGPFGPPWGSIPFPGVCWT